MTFNSFPQRSPKLYGKNYNVSCIKIQSNKVKHPATRASVRKASFVPRHDAAHPLRTHLTDSLTIANCHPDVFIWPFSRRVELVLPILSQPNRREPFPG